MTKTQAIEFALQELRADNNHILIYATDELGSFVRCKFDGTVSSKYYYEEHLPQDDMSSEVT